MTLAAACLLPLGTPAAGAPRPPNILHLHADDFRADALGAFGHPVVQTPHLDSLVARGTTFSRCYTMGAMTPAVCLPSRTMMLTGRSLFRIGPPSKSVPDTTPLPTVLQRRGYDTWRMGKYGNEYFAGARAFATNIDDSGQGTGEVGSRAFASRRLADRAIEYLRTRDRTKPFYMYLAPPVPHDPREAEPRFHEMYDAARIPLPPAFAPLHPWDNGDMTVRDEKLAPWPRSPDDTRRQLAAYYACITGFDHHVGRILEALRADGEEARTIIVFSGDNGLSLGDHGLFGKQNLYEFGGMHVPLVLAGPGIRHGRSEALVYLLDLYRTFCDFAGAEPPAGTEGESLRPFLSDPARPGRPFLFTAYLDCQRAIRDERWKLIRYPRVDRTQLFDLAADPHELHNLADSPAHAATLARLRARLGQEAAQLGDTAPWTSPNVQPAAWSPPNSPPTTAPPPREKVLRDLSYGPHPERHRLDLYLPAEPSTAARPLVVWIHSGGWYTGGRGGGGPARALVPRGYAVASISYRFSQEAIFPAQIEDCQRAIRWLRAHAREYGLDPQRFGAWGGSAGGHLAALLGTAPEQFRAPADDPHRELSAHVAAVCAFNPPTDFLSWDDQALPNPAVVANQPGSMVARLLGAPPALAPAAARLASPLAHVTARSAPVFLVHGDKDRAVPPRQSATLHAALRTAGVEATLHLIPGAGHADPAFAQGVPHEAIAAFFDRHLQPNAPATPPR